MAERKRLNTANKKTTPVELPQFHGLRPLKAIRAKCMDCVGQQSGEVRRCTAFNCPLWPYRMGVRPHHKRAQSANEEAKKAAEASKGSAPLHEIDLTK